MSKKKNVIERYKNIRDSEKERRGEEYNKKWSFIKEIIESK
jgi:hypothetical protein